MVCLQPCLKHIMSLIPESLKKRFAALDSHASIHRHAQMGMAEELQHLSASVTHADSRDTYGRGGLVTAFEQELSTLFQQPGCLFLPTGTLAQCVALKCYSDKVGRSGVGLHPTSHLLLHEHMSIEALWGLEVIEMGQEQGVLTARDVLQLNPEKIASVIIETPMREIGGTLPSWEDLNKIRVWCDDHGIKMHLDGARIWQCTVFYQRSLADIVSIFDSAYVSFYKDLGGIFGAALLGPDALIEQARIWARRAGGNPITLYPEVVAARDGLSNYLSQIPHFVKYTQSLCQILSSKALTILPAKPQVNMFHIQFNMDAETLTRNIISYAECTGVVVLPLPRSGDRQSCICEVSIGSQATSNEPQFWGRHIEACLAYKT